MRAITMAMAATTTVLLGAVVWLQRRRRKVEGELEVERKLRLEERRGRTRAEVALRNWKKQVLRVPTLDGSDKEEASTFVLRPIGVVRSPFVKRAGTPRQGMVCPHGRGVLELTAKHWKNVTAICRRRTYSKPTGVFSVTSMMVNLS